MKLTLLKEWDNAGEVFKPEDMTGQYLDIADEAVVKQLVKDGTCKEYVETSDSSTKTDVTIGARQPASRLRIWSIRKSTRTKSRSARHTPTLRWLASLWSGTAMGSRA